MKTSISIIVAIFGLGITSGAMAQDWWSSPPQDDDQYFYGLGEGYTVSQAQELALNSIAGKLGTTIASEMSRKTQDFSGQTSDNIVRTITAQVKDIELGFYSVLKTTQSETGTRVLVRLDKKKLAVSWEQQLSHLKSKLLSLIRQGSATSLGDLLKLKDASLEASKADELEMRLSSISNYASGPSIRQAIDGLLAQSAIAIGVKGTLPNMNKLLEQQLVEQNIAICHINCTTWITHEAKVSRREMFGQYVSSLTIEFSVIDDNQVMKTQSWEHQVSSISNHKAADNGVVMMAIEAQQERGIWLSLGFKNI